MSEPKVIAGRDVAATVELLDGPAAEGFRFRHAKGSNVIARCPSYLRAVIDANGEVDVLDQLGDAPADGERVVVYGLTTLIHYRGDRSSGWHATYRHIEGAPTIEVRDAARWRAWCEGQR